MFGDRLIEEFETLNFRHQPKMLRIACDDPQIWIEDCTGPWQETRGFVLAYHGKRIGFAEPLDRSEVEAEIAKAETNAETQKDAYGVIRRKTWIIGRLGVPVQSRDYDLKTYVDVADPYKFENTNEQDRVVAIIKVALRQHLDIFRRQTTERSRVIFTPTLLGKICSGELIVQGGYK